MIDKALIIHSLEHAAEVHGDITPLVCADLLERHPEAEVYFDVKGTQFKADLQAKMVQDSIYSCLEYLDVPEEAEIVLKYTIPQHQDLGIPIKHFFALLESLANVVCAASEQESGNVKASWQSLMQELKKIISHNTSEVF
jgi:hemoglobin-like flavoprotein